MPAQSRNPRRPEHRRWRRRDGGSARRNLAGRNPPGARRCPDAGDGAESAAAARVPPERDHDVAGRRIARAPSRPCRGHHAPDYCRPALPGRRHPPLTRLRIASRLQAARTVALAGLGPGVILWLGLFLVVASEGFLMRQSPEWNAKTTVFHLAPLAFLVFDAMQDEDTHRAGDIARAEGRIPGLGRANRAGRPCGTLDGRTLLRRTMTDAAKSDDSRRLPDRRWIDSGLCLPSVRSGGMRTIAVIVKATVSRPRRHRQRSGRSCEGSRPGSGSSASSCSRSIRRSRRSTTCPGRSRQGPGRHRLPAGM